MPSLRKFPRRTSKSRHVYEEGDEESIDGNEKKRRKEDISISKANKAYCELRSRYNWHHKKSSGLESWKLIASGCTDKDEEGRCWFNGYRSLAIHLDEVGWDLEKLDFRAKKNVSGAQSHDRQNVCIEQGYPGHLPVHENGSESIRYTISQSEENVEHAKLGLQQSGKLSEQQLQREMEQLPLQNFAAQQRQHSDLMKQKDVAGIIHSAEVTLYGEPGGDSVRKRLEFLEEDVGLSNSTGTLKERARQVFAIIGEYSEDRPIEIELKVP